MLRFDVSLELLLESGMGQLKYSWAILSRLMYRDFSLFVSYRHLYIANILYSLVYSDLFPLHDYRYCFRIDIFDICLSALWCIYCFVILHFVSEWHKPPCRRSDPGSVCWNSSFKFIISLIFLTRRYSIEAFIRMVAPHQPYSSSWSTTFLVNGLGQGEYWGGALHFQ